MKPRIDLSLNQGGGLQRLKFEVRRAACGALQMEQGALVLPCPCTEAPMARSLERVLFHVGMV